MRRNDLVEVDLCFVPSVEENQAVTAPASDARVGTTSDLVPFIPRLTLEWLRDEPETSWREVEGPLAFIDISGFKIGRAHV